MIRRAWCFLPLMIVPVLAGCGGSAVSTGSPTGAADAAFSVPQQTLDAALSCPDGFTHPDRPAILLVHGTFTAGFEQYQWTYQPLLENLGYDTCYVTYPDRGLGDQQVSAEYVADAIMRLHQMTGHKISVIGHSQGVSVTRWAIRWWPSVRDDIDDFVMEAGPNHGTTSTLPFTAVASLGLVGVPAAFLQFAPDSQFVAAENLGDETPGDISYTALYTQDDELVEPVSPVPTAAVDYGQGNPAVSNILLQDVCPGRIVDHVTIGLFDALAFQLAVDAISHPGPADIDRTIADNGGRTALCGAVSIVPMFAVAPLPQLITGLLQIVQQEPGNGLPALHLATREPPLMSYAQ